jgi:hypothetical protein
MFAAAKEYLRIKWFSDDPKLYKITTTFIHTYRYIYGERKRGDLEDPLSVERKALTQTE